MMRALFIALLLAGRNSQPFNLSAGYLLELGLPASRGLGDEEQDQTVPCFAELAVGRILHTGED